MPGLDLFSTSESEKIGNLFVYFSFPLFLAFPLLSLFCGLECPWPRGWVDGQLASTTGWKGWLGYCMVFKL